MTDRAVAVIVPVLRRPHSVAPLIDSLAAATPDGMWRCMFMVSTSDPDELAAVHAVADGDQIVCATTGRPGGVPGDYPRKINLGAQLTSEPFLFTGADDLHFHDGWLEQILERAERREDIGVFGTNDLYNPRVIRGHHSTHSMVTRAYINDPGGPADEQPGVVLHEGYPHEYADDELIHTARFRRAYLHVHTAVVEHLHHYAKKAPPDPVYALGHSWAPVGKAVYDSREHLWNYRQRRRQARRGVPSGR